MATIRRFEDLIAWQKARALTRHIYAMTRQGSFRSDYGLAGQIQRAAVSVMSNIAEGFERSRLGEFHQFLSTSKSSCAELRSQLYVALDVGHVTEQTFNQAMALAEETSRVVGGLRASIQRERDKPTQDSGLRTQD